MRTVTAFKSDDGQLHSEATRCAASNMHHRLPMRDQLSNEKVLTFSACLDVIKHRATIEEIFRDLDSGRALQETSK